MSYIPQVNDYVTWSKGIEGWVYFKDTEYITIEVSVKPKDDENYRACALHQNERLLVLCYNNQWKELTYVKSRQSVYEEEKENIVEIVGESTWGEGDEK
jgi:hypothetical protein